MKVYEKIFDRLNELHMSQNELSRRTGIATSTISDWRKKEINPQADKLVPICDALDMSLEELLFDKPGRRLNQTARLDLSSENQIFFERFVKAPDSVQKRVIQYFDAIYLQE